MHSPTVVTLLLAALILAGPPLHAEEVDHAPSVDEPGSARLERRTLERLPVNALRNMGGLVSKDNALPALAGAAATAVAFALEDRARREVSGSDLGGLQRFGDKIGDADVVVPLALGAFAAGRIAGPGRFRAMTYDLVQAQLVVTAVGGTAKRLVGRERPNRSNDLSFPSGHSYSWFATATVVQRHYGTAAALPAYGLWALSGLSRMANDTHHFGDIVGGAALGYMVARATRRVNDAPASGTRRLQITPLAMQRGLGVALVLDF